MTQTVAAQRVVEGIRTAFPADAETIDTLMTSEGFDPKDAPHIWIEHFSQRTTDALKGGCTAEAESHLSLLSRLLDTADDDTEKCIDVASVESLMWDLKDEKKKTEAWALVPTNLIKLYVAMWGGQHFMDKHR
jgi:hypothetical protein